ncbi:MAG: ATP-dependent zinc metalloprotease FtsH [Verrucomicrobia bacterium]|nr:ATP-dependent zinc metalloprotease FtsH [Verrucomicrobiota bacterium]
MSNDNKSRPEPRKGFPGGFIIFLLAGLLIFMTVQNMSTEQTAKVAFSHQVESLVDLDLIQPTESRKIAQNDNLVTFTGKFRDRLSDESKARYKYLELLNSHNELTEQKQQLQNDLSTLQKNVTESADWFLHLSGLPVPSAGYWVVDPLYDTASRENSIVVKSLSDRPIVSFAELSRRYPPSADQAEAFGKDLVALVQGFRSSALGIGNEEMKQQLRTLEQNLSLTGQTPQQQIAAFGPAMAQLKTIIASLNTETDNARLVQLRTVRNYLADLAQYNQVVDDSAKNDVQLDKARQAVANVIWYFNNQELSSRALEKQNPELFSNWFSQAKSEWDAFQTNKGTVFRAPDQPRTLVLEKTFKSEEPSPNYFSYLFTILPFLFLGFLLYFIFARQMKGVGSGAMNFGKSPAKLLSKDRNKVTFKDVAGCDEAKEELQEIVEFLKDPGKFTALGARIPKGVLCIGAPGTGKTLIAKAVAGEADRPFFFISGSDFVEMFVGVGASRIRDMFNEARKFAPCIIFMDEIDAVGRHRGAGMGGGHDEREQTLNQLLVEMDGFDPTEGIILIAATNRPDVLDKALLRPGRFDRRIIIDLPDIKGRFEILKVHARKIKLDPSVDLMEIARGTPGASGADLANILNEAALLAARRNRSAVTAAEAREAVDKVKYGKERRSLEIDENEKRTTAYHESGHAIVALVVKNADPVDKVTIIPRGLSLGATHFMPKKNRLSYWRKELIDQLAVLMGGRAAEEIFVGDMSSGAQMDITQATRLARSMVCEWGMSDLGTIAFDERSEGGSYLGMPNVSSKTYSNETAMKIDAEVYRLINDGHEKALEIVKASREKVELMTEMLMEFETLDKKDVEELMNGTWNIETKRARLKAEEELSRKIPAPAPARDLPKVSDTPEPQGI